MRKKLLTIAITAIMAIICCACSNTLEGFAGSYFTSADGWSADSKGTTYTRETTDGDFPCTDSIHFAGNYVTWNHAVDKEIETDKAVVAKAFMDLSDAAGIRNGTVDYTLIIDGTATEHFTMSYEEAAELGE